MSLTQKQKDTIREEFEKWHTSETTFALGVPDDWTIADWWLNKLDQAYQQGAKDKVEEVSNKVVVYFNPSSDYCDLSHEDRIKVNAEEGTIFLADTTEGVWGDDWNDAPDDCNSGTPYPETMKNSIEIKVQLGKPLNLLKDNT